ncbi:hypothetical protein QYM36_001868 [Artemia franciscana]|uniref:Uncharacterized protein n=1 Tax=Artemia franciscana TaxID=6661 RepID=A0AA88IFI2_ARTSF|nr:hypothetical protein QYM36_001868 [Artemia franciscana]
MFALNIQKFVRVFQDLAYTEQCDISYKLFLLLYSTNGFRQFARIIAAVDAIAIVILGATNVSDKKKEPEYLRYISITKADLDLYRNSLELNIKGKTFGKFLTTMFALNIQKFIRVFQDLAYTEQCDIS